MVTLKMACRVDANNTMGIGHFMRTLSFAQLFSAKNAQITFLSCELKPHLIEQLQRESIAYQPLQASIGSTQDAEQTMAYMASEGMNAIVFDSYLFSDSYYSQYKQVPFKGFIDDFGHVFADLNFVINQNPWGDEIPYPTKMQRFLGLEYALLRQEFWQYSDYQKLKGDLLHLLIVMGGTDPHHMTFPLFQLINHHIHKKIKITIICNVQETLNLIPKEKSIHEVQSVEHVDDFPKLLTTVDVCLSAAGSTCWELAYMHIQTFCIIQATNQINVAEYIEEKSLGFNLGWYHNIDTKKLLDNLNLMLFDFGQQNDKFNAQSIVIGSKTKTIPEFLNVCL